MVMGVHGGLSHTMAGQESEKEGPDWFLSRTFKALSLLIPFWHVPSIAITNIPYSNDNMIHCMLLIQDILFSVKSGHVVDQNPHNF